MDMSADGMMGCGANSNDSNKVWFFFIILAPCSSSTYPVVGRDSVGPAVEISHRVDLQRKVVQESVGGVETGDLNASVAPHYGRGWIRLNMERYPW